MRFCYSTIAHAHGDRLLNVGLTRAIRVMKVFYHPRMAAPAEHDPKPGKRAFGWLVRFLLRTAPQCKCADCVARFERLMALGQSAATAAAAAGDAAADTVPLLWRCAEGLLRSSCRRTPGLQLLQSCCAVGQAPGKGAAAAPRVGVAMEARGAAAQGALAVLLDSEADCAAAPRDSAMLPAALCSSKIGWSRSATLRASGLLNELQRTRPTAPMAAAEEDGTNVVRRGPAAAVPRHEQPVLIGSAHP